MDLRISKNGAYVGGGALAKLKIEKTLRYLEKIYYYPYVDSRNLGIVFCSLNA